MIELVILLICLQVFLDPFWGVNRFFSRISKDLPREISGIVKSSRKWLWIYVNQFYNHNLIIFYSVAESYFSSITFISLSSVIQLDISLPLHMYIYINVFVHVYECLCTFSIPVRVIIFRTVFVCTDWSIIQTSKGLKTGTNNHFTKQEHNLLNNNNNE